MDSKLKFEIVDSAYESFKFKYALFERASDDIKDTLVFIGGAFQDIKASYKICRELSQYFNVISVDLPGSGASDILPPSYPFSYLADVVQYVVNQVGIEKVHLVGCSYGSPIAYSFSQAFPERIKRLILTGVMKEIPAGVRQAVNMSVKLIERGDVVRFDELMGRMFFNLDRTSEIPNQSFIRERFSKALREMDYSMKLRYVSNTRRLLKARLNPTPRVFAPVLIVTGRYDSFTEPAYCKEFSSMCENSICTFIDSADHFFHVEKPNVTIELVKTFLLGDNISVVAGHGDLSEDSGSHQKTEEPIIDLI